MARTESGKIKRAAARAERSGLRAGLRHFWHHTLNGSWWRRLLLYLISLILILIGGAYGVAEWYIHKHSKEPLQLGATFIASYASYLGVDPHQTYLAMLQDLGLRQVRLVSYWDQLEPTPGHYDFSELDWEFSTANQYGAKVSLAIGLRQPRWPECHVPNWAQNEPFSKQEPQLYRFMTEVVNHYKNNPALDSYQLENEYFMSIFGNCKNFDRSRLVHEFNMVKKLDPVHKIIVSRSNNWVGIPVNAPTPDEFGISVYKRVWDATVTKRYFEYPLPPWFYAFLAGAEELYSGKDMVIHEMQAEPWPPGPIPETSVKEQYKSMDAQRLAERIKYAEDTGMREIYLWGAEWWYYMKVKQDDPSIWNVVKTAVAQADEQNLKLARDR